MDKTASFSELALEGVARMRKQNNDLRGRVASLLLLLRGRYFTGAAEAGVPAEGDAWSAAWHFGAGEPPPRLRGASEPDAVERAERTLCEVRAPKAGTPP